MADIYVVLLLALGTFIGFSAAWLVTMFVFTSKRVVKYFGKRAFEAGYDLGNDLSDELPWS